LNRERIEDTVSKQLTDGGMTVRKHSDEDTYVYVNVMAGSLSNGTCISRYDLFLYTHATTKLSYGTARVLAQVLLMHRGGMSTSSVADHAATVGRGLEGFVTLFLQQIHDANK